MSSSDEEMVRDSGAEEERRKEKKREKKLKKEKKEAKEARKEKKEKVKAKEEKKSKKAKKEELAQEETSAPNEAEDVELPDARSPSSKKRKRDDAQGEELEIDLSLPEPQSKKALRKAKKAKSTKKDGAETEGEADEAGESEKAQATDGSKRSQWGIWIGNLPWSATKAGLKVFFTEHANLKESEITRIHMPKPRPDQKHRVQVQNRGFAYVDFSSSTAMQQAMALNEHDLFGRNVLIKDAKSFEGRPDKPKSEEGQKVVNGKPPNQRIFVGNLGFDVTREDLTEHFSKCGEVKDVFMATFEDSGKSKGFAWVTFATIEAAEGAVRGWVLKQQEEDSDEEEGKEKKPRKVFVNKLHGRDLRCEFAEDSTTRYNKRFGKDKQKKESGQDNWVEEVPSDTKRFKRTGNQDWAAKQGPAAANFKVEPQGKKIVFD